MDELVNRRYPSEIDGLKTQIMRLGHSANEPPKTQIDVDRVTSALNEIREHRSELSAELEELTRQHDDSKINLIRNQVAVYKKKAAQQQTALDRSEQQLMKCESERKMLEAQLERIQVSSFGQEILVQQSDPQKFYCSAHHYLTYLSFVFRVLAS